MSVPSRVEACRLLLSLDPPSWLVRHCTVVAEIAAFLAARISHAERRAGAHIDRARVEASALLHDLDKALPAEHSLRRLVHGRAGAAWLTEHDHGELASAVADHPVTRLTDERVFARWWQSASLEDRVVAYADKRALQALVPMDRRFADWQRRYPDSEERQRLGRRRAEELEMQVCAAASIEPTDVRRLRWVASAMAVARSQ